MTANQDQLLITIQKCQKLAAQVDPKAQLQYFESEAEYKRSLKLFFRDLTKDKTLFYGMTYPFLGSYLLDVSNFTKIVAILPGFVPSLIRTGVDRIVTYTSFRKIKKKGTILLDNESDRFTSEILLETWDLLFKSGNTFPIEAEIREKIVSTLNQSVITKSHYDILGCFQAVYNSLIIYLGQDVNIDTRNMFTADHDHNEKRTLLYELVGPVAKPVHLCNRVKFNKVSYSGLQELIRHAYSDQNLFPTPPQKEMEDADFIVIQDEEKMDRISESTINYTKPPSIADYDTLALDFKNYPIRIDKFKFRLENSKKKVEPTEWVELQTTNATFLYFLALNRKHDPDHDCLSISPIDKKDWLEIISKKFDKFTNGVLKKELLGVENTGIVKRRQHSDQNKSPHSWVFGSRSTRSKYASRINKAFCNTTKVVKKQVHSHGPLLIPCDVNGYQIMPHITRIIHKIPPKKTNDVT